MGSQQSARDFEWGYLIQADKSPAPRLEQLCLGLAGVISDLDPSSSTKELTPEKLAAFYRAVGGNYDSLFLNTPSPSLSFIYQSLGCFHTLQPTKSAFEPPSIPALLPHGFIRWQTIQLLLCPEEHAPFLQRAVEMFDIVDAHDGFLLPKTIPASAFPTHPDPDMVKWHEAVSNRLELESAETTPNARPSNDPHPSSAANCLPARTRQPKTKGDEGDYFTQGNHYSSTNRKPHQATQSRPSSREPYGRIPHPLRRTEVPNYADNTGPKTAGYVRPDGNIPRSKSSNHYRGHSSPPTAYRRSWPHPGEFGSEDEEEIIIVEHNRPTPQARRNEKRRSQEPPGHENAYPSRSSHIRHHSHESMYRQRQHPHQSNEAPRRRPQEDGPEIYYSYPPSKHIPEIKPAYENDASTAFPTPKHHNQPFHPRYADIFDDDGMMHLHHSPSTPRRGSRASAHADRSHLSPIDGENPLSSPPMSPTSETYGDSMAHLERSRPLRHQSLKESRPKKGRGGKGVEIRPRSHSRGSPTRRHHHYYQDYRHIDDQIHSARASRERSRSRGPRRGEDETWSESDSSIEIMSDEDYPPTTTQPYAAPPAPMPPAAGPIPPMTISGGARENSRRAKYAAKLEATFKNGLRNGSKDKRRRGRNSGSGDGQYPPYVGNMPRSHSSHRR
ncbi:hypothetical protein FQN49_004247 [Arthroderma sp. PD_2]|nr:hypothetical protein FQN49_004247 [Arthroderma sp. PD_2]